MVVGQPIDETTKNNLSGLYTITSKINLESLGLPVLCHYDLFVDLKLSLSTSEILLKSTNNRLELLHLTSMMRGPLPKPTMNS